jgi:uroporphyrinogen-III decarboxylase
MLHGGHIMLRDDSAMNLSPAMYETFVKPYDQRLFDVLSGGAVHFCGRGDHYIESLSNVRGLHAINLSQPHLNDMEKIFRNTVDKGLAVLALPREAADAALAAGRDLKGLVHCT